MNQHHDDYFDADIDTYRHLPVFIQVEVICEIVEGIVDGISIEDTTVRTECKKAMYKYHTHSMMENALLIPSKIVEAHQSELFDIKMECATFIRKAAMDILIDAQGLHRAGFNEPDYIVILKESIETFRPLFARWVATFNPKNYLIDRWGLFNPEGVHYTDPSPSSHNTFYRPNYLDRFDDCPDDQEEDQ